MSLVCFHVVTGIQAALTLLLAPSLAPLSGGCILTSFTSIFTLDSFVGHCHCTFVHH